MEEKIIFGKYILQKRKEAGLSQKALAEKLFVSESAVSKWERGLSYPDITLITSLCDALDISERELLTASDDMHQRKIEEQSRGYLRIIRTYSWVTYLGYAAALIPTFIWAVSTRHMSVFFIVAAALVMVFSLINVPVLAKDQKPHKVFWSFYGSLILLLVVCRLANVEADSPHWLIMAILGVTLGLFSAFLPPLIATSRISHPLKNHKALVCMLIDTVLVYLLVFFGYLFYADGGLAGVRGGFLVTAVVAGWVWLVFAIFRYAPFSRLLKSFLTVGLCGALMFFAQSIADTVMDGVPFVLPDVNFRAWPDCIDGNVGVLAMIFGAALAVITIVRDARNRKQA